MSSRSIGRSRLLAAMLAALTLALGTALAGCGQGEANPPGGRKNPFATGNVSVAPQIEGGPSAPTPVPAPRPTIPLPTPQAPSQ